MKELDHCKKFIYSGMKEMKEYNHCKKFMHSGMKEMNEYNHCKTFIYLGMKEMKVNLRPRMKTLLMEQIQTQIPPPHPGTKTPPLIHAQCLYAPL